MRRLSSGRWGQKAALCAAFLLLLPLAACSSGEEAEAVEGQSIPAAITEKIEKTRNVRTLELQRGILDETVLITGPLSPSQEANLSAEESGVVSAIVAAKGSKVEKGAPLVSLDRGLLAAEWNSAKAALFLHQQNYERSEQLLEQQRISQQEMLGIHTQLKQAEATEQIARLRHRRAQTRAPFDGVVSDILVDKGELLAPGMPVARMIDPYELILEGHVSENEIRWLIEGAPAEVEVTGLDRLLPASISWISPEAQPGSGKFPVELKVKNPDLLLRAGVVGRARVLKTRHENVVAIPRDAVVEEEGQRFVFIVQDNRAVRRSLQLGAVAGKMVLVQEGLTAGDALVVRGQRELRDGGPVKVTERATHSDGRIATEAQVR